MSLDQLLPTQLVPFRRREERKARMRQLSTEISAIVTASDSYDANLQRFMALTSEFNYLKQLNMVDRAEKLGIAIEKDWLRTPGPSTEDAILWQGLEEERESYRGELTDGGQRALDRLLRKHKQERIEFWSKLVVPYVALILSLIALLRKN